MAKLPVTLAATLMLAGEFAEGIDALLNNSANLNYIATQSPVVTARHGTPFVMPGCPQTIPDEESGLSLYRGWLRCAGYHQIDVFVVESSRVLADRMVDAFQVAVNTFPNRRKDIFDSDTLEYAGQIVYDDLTIEDLEIQIRSRSNTPSLTYTLLPDWSVS